jgi:hypothetical protein
MSVVGKIMRYDVIREMSAGPGTEACFLGEVVTSLLYKAVS